MSSKNKLSLNLFEANLERHPSIKGLYDENGKEIPIKYIKKKYKTIIGKNEAEELAQREGLIFFECSAKTNENILEILYLILKIKFCVINCNMDNPKQNNELL